LKDKETCEDRISDCADYGHEVCTALKYHPWATDNCKKHCGFCGQTQHVMTSMYMWIVDFFFHNLNLYFFNVYKSVKAQVDISTQYKSLMLKLSQKITLRPTVIMIE
jgi:small-conductance mechanosensitive channel